MSMPETDRLPGQPGFVLPENPYPGLRSFTSEEWPIFFGREPMMQEVIRRMAGMHLVMIHGDSGCGKSSLIRAGVLPALQQDSSRAKTGWRTCIAQPGANPMRNLAEALAGLEEPATEERIRTFRRAFRNREQTITRLVELLDCSAENSVCLLMDQFEELFEHSRYHGPADAELILSFLRRLVEERPTGLFVLLTMRTDYLGRCAQYEGFAEVVNEAQYLVPYMDRGGLLRAITAPAELYGGAVDYALATRLANEASRGQDRLPLLQHGLRMMWTRRQASGKGMHLTIDDLDDGTSLATRLSVHADEVMEEATGGDGKKAAMVEQVFRALMDCNAEGLGIRRAQTYQDLLGVTKSSDEMLQSILACFRSDEVCFLRPYGDGPLTGDTQVDITHEVLIRNWNKITDRRTGWLENETKDSLIWNSLRLQTDDYMRDPGKLLSVAVAQDRQVWMEEHNAAWARRYGGDWEAAAKLVADCLNPQATTWAHGGRRGRDVVIPLESMKGQSGFDQASRSGESTFHKDYEEAQYILQQRKCLIDYVKGGQVSSAFLSVRKLRDLGYEQLLDFSDRGENVYELHPAFWAALTGNDRKDPYNKKAESIFSGEEGKKWLKRTTSRGLTVLAWAALAGKIDLIRRLVEGFGVDTGVLDTDGSSIVHMAAVGGNLETIRYLVESCNLDPKQVNTAGSSPIVWAIQEKHHEVVDYFLSHGQDIHFLADGSWNALTEAARADDLDYFCKLVKQDHFDLGHRTRDGQTLLHIACRGDRTMNSKVAAYLAVDQRADLLDKTDEKQTALHFAAQSGKLSAIAVLVEAAKARGGDAIKEVLNAQDSEGNTPLHLALYSDYAAAAEDLLEAGANPNIENNLQIPPLVVAAVRGDRISVERLIRRGGRTDLYPDWGILHYAADDGDLDMLTTICRMGAAIDWNMRETSAGWTPLMQACDKGWVDCVAFLLSGKVDVNASLKDKFNRRDALEIAKTNLRLAQLSKKESGRRRAGDFAGIVQLLVTHTERLADAGSDIFTANEGNEGDKQGEGPESSPELVSAARRGDTPKVRDLLEWDSVLPPSLGKAIRAAAMAGHREVLDVLLEATEENVTVDDLSTYAEEASQRGETECVRALISRGAREPYLWHRTKVSASANFLNFALLRPEEESGLKQRLEFFGLAMQGASSWQITQAQLPFFKGCVLLAIEFQELPGQNEQFAILAPDGEIVLLNWTNEPIYSLADRYLVLSSEGLALLYVRFFFLFVRGSLGTFRIVDNVDQIPWKSEATSEERERVRAALEPCRVVEEREEFFVFAATVVFRDALFSTKVQTAKIATSISTEDGQTEAMTRGQNRLFDEELLLEDLAIEVARPPTVFG